jgi:hypothetical protein
MNSECSLPSFQEPATDRFPELDESSPHHTPPSILILFFPSGFPNKILYGLVEDNDVSVITAKKN